MEVGDDGECQVMPLAQGSNEAAAEASLRKPQPPETSEEPLVFTITLLGVGVVLILVHVHTHVHALILVLPFALTLGLAL